MVSNDREGVVVGASGSGNKLKNGLFVQIRIVGREIRNKEIRRILGDLGRAQDHLSRDFVDVYDTDREVAEEVLASDIRGSQADLKARFRLKVEDRIRKKLGSGNLEQGVI